MSIVTSNMAGNVDRTDELLSGNSIYCLAVPLLCNPIIVMFKVNVGEIQDWNYTGIEVEEKEKETTRIEWKLKLIKKEEKKWRRQGHRRGRRIRE